MSLTESTPPCFVSKSGSFHGTEDSGPESGRAARVPPGFPATASACGHGRAGSAVLSGGPWSEGWRASAVHTVGQYFLKVSNEPIHNIIVI